MADKAEKIKDKQGSIELDINENYLFAGMALILSISALVLEPGLIYPIGYLALGGFLAFWVLPKEKRSIGKISLLSVFGPTAPIPVLLLKNYYSFMHIEEKEKDAEKDI
jgi:hypothetical protein